MTQDPTRADDSVVERQYIEPAFVDEVVDRGALVGIGPGLDDGAAFAGDFCERTQPFEVGEQQTAADPDAVGDRGDRQLPGKDAARLHLARIGEPYRWTYLQDRLSIKFVLLCRHLG